LDWLGLDRTMLDRRHWRAATVPASSGWGWRCWKALRRVVGGLLDVVVLALELGH